MLKTVTKSPRKRYTTKPQMKNTSITQNNSNESSQRFRQIANADVHLFSLDAIRRFNAVGKSS